MMASFNQWVHAARPQTLPASLAPVLAGVGATCGLGWASPLRSALALFLALILQVAVNFSNDYSDGVRGTDAQGKRVGPLRLTGAGLVAPRTMLAAALVCYGLAGVSGLTLVLLSGRYWLLLAGAAALAAGWFYTGGKRPYGYLPGISEVLIFVFFGWAALVGTVYVQAPATVGLFALPWQVWAGASALGLISCAILMANNLRDRVNDERSGKRTLAVAVGERGARALYCAYLLLNAVLAGAGVWTGAATPERELLVSLALGAGLALAGVPLGRRVATGQTPAGLIAVMKRTGQLTLVTGLALALLWATRGF